GLVFGLVVLAFLFRFLERFLGGQLDDRLLAGADGGGRGGHDRFTGNVGSRGRGGQLGGQRDRRGRRLRSGLGGLLHRRRGLRLGLRCGRLRGNDKGCRLCAGRRGRVRGWSARGRCALL